MMFSEFHMMGDTKAMRYGIIVMKILLRDTIVEKRTQLRPRFVFILFMERKRDKANTTDYSKRGIV